MTWDLWALLEGNAEASGLQGNIRISPLACAPTFSPAGQTNNGDSFTT